MDAYISEAQVTSCDSADVLHTDIIQPGHKTICSAMITIERDDHLTRSVKGKLGSCGSVSIAHGT
jgi:hypothetical protein